MEPLNIRTNALRYRGLIGTGGIGSGAFFALEGDHTLGREESRAGRFLDRKDYCKLHIIAHYVSVLTGGDFRTVPVGMVGDDAPGRRLIEEMRDAGMDTQHVRAAAGEQTLYSFCFIYPNGEGGNMTVDDSASSHVDAAAVRDAESEFVSMGAAGIALAAPEVPLEARAELLKLATEHGLLRTASFTSGELTQPAIKSMLADTDVLAINVDEAAVIADAEPDDSPEAIVDVAASSLRRIQPDIIVSITAGSHGNWIAAGDSLAYLPAVDTQVVSTAGAGDAHFSGLLVGLAAGLVPIEAQHLARLVATLSVTSPHTIKADVDRVTLAAFAREHEVELPDSVARLLENPS